MSYVPGPASARSRATTPSTPSPAARRSSSPGFDIDVLFTPGHSPGHVTYSVARRAACSSPATCCSRARSAAPTCPAATRLTLLRSIAGAARDACPDETAVLPGHMGVTTLGRERATNPFLSELVATVSRADPGAARHVRRAARGRAGRATRSSRTRRGACSSAPATGASRRPTFEATELFARGVGESTDIVQKEMYTFDDGGGRSLTLRPEGTAPVVPRLPRARHAQAAAAREALVPRRRFFRREAPQAGRYRQFWQVGAEAIGSDDPAVDAELDRAARRAARGARRARACACGSARSARRRRARATARSCTALPARARGPSSPRRSRARIDLNPLRAFDADHRGHPAGDGERAAAARPPRRRRPRALRRRSASCSTTPGVAYEIDPTLVRGLDYYTRTVFEFTSDALGAQSGVGGGGRYDGLIEQLGGPPTPGLRLGRGRRADAAGLRRPPIRRAAGRPLRRARRARAPPRRLRARPTRRAAPASAPSSSSPGARSRASSSRPTGWARATLRSLGDDGVDPQGHGVRRAATSRRAEQRDRATSASRDRCEAAARQRLPRRLGRRRCDASDAGETVRVAGWVHRRRDHGGLIFIDLRDRCGLVQLVFHPETAAEAPRARRAAALRARHLGRRARSCAREAGNVNPNLATGEIEISVASSSSSSPTAETPPFPLDEDGAGRRGCCGCATASLDLRRAGDAATRLALRHAVVAAMRDELNDARLPRDRDADPDALDARGRARLPRARPRSRPARSTRCRSRRSCSSSC